MRLNLCVKGDTRDIGHPFYPPKYNHDCDWKWSGRCLVSLPRRHKCITCACRNLPTLKQPANPTPHGKPRPTTTIPAIDDDGKKKTKRGGNFGEGEELGVRIEVVVLGHDEETQGEPQTPEKGFGVSHVVDEPTKQTDIERERGQQTAWQTGVKS